MQLSSIYKRHRFKCIANNFHLFLGTDRDSTIKIDNYIIGGFAMNGRAHDAKLACHVAMQA